MVVTVVIVLAISIFCNCRKFANKVEKEGIDPN